MGNMDIKGWIEKVDVELEIFEMGDITLNDNTHIYFKIIDEKEFNKQIEKEKSDTKMENESSKRDYKQEKLDSMRKRYYIVARLHYILNGIIENSLSDEQLDKVFKELETTMELVNKMRR